MTATDQLLTTAEAAEYLSVKKRTLAEHWFEWKIPVHRVGRNNRYRVSDLEQYLADHRITEPLRVN